MKWLGEPQDDIERKLREALDQAARRTGDQITHRRVWAKISDAMAKPQPRVARRLVFASAAVVLVAGAGVVGLPMLLDHFTADGAAGTVVTPAAQPIAGKTAVAIHETSESTTSDPAASSPAAKIERVPGQFVRTRAGERARVALGGGAEAELRENSAITWDAQQRPSVEQGAAVLSVPHQPPGWRFSVTAGPYVVTVVGTKFEVAVDGRTVGVDVTEGVVEVWHGSRSTRLVAGDSWRGPFNLDQAEPEKTTATEKPRSLAPRHAGRAPAFASRDLQDAQAALQMGNTSKAVDMLTRIASGTGPAAENASYELGRITRYNLNRPRQAVTLWDKYRTRFPNGLLRTEADLSIVETLSSLGEGRAAIAEADAFLARHPASERRLEVQRLAERLRAAESAAGAR